EQQCLQVGHGTDESSNDVLDGLGEPLNNRTSSNCLFATGRDVAPTNRRLPFKRSSARQQFFPPYSVLPCAVSGASSRLSMRTSVSTSTGRSMGLATCPSKPASNARARSSPLAMAVSASATTSPPSSEGSARTRRIKL